MAKQKEVEVVGTFVEMCVERLRKIDPEYNVEKLFKLIDEFPITAQALYEDEYKRMFGVSQDVACGVDSETVTDTPQRSENAPTNYVDYDNVVCKFTTWKPRVDAGFLIDTCNAAASILCDTGDIHNWRLYKSQKYPDQFSVVADTLEYTLRLSFFVDGLDIQFCFCDTAPPNSTLLKEIIASIKNMGDSTSC